MANTSVLLFESFIANYFLPFKNFDYNESNQITGYLVLNCEYLEFSTRSILLDW